MTPLLLALVSLLAGEPITSAATTFGPSSLDPLGNPAPGALACWRSVPGTPHYLDETTLAVASYKWQCGDLLRICSGERCVEARVLDRGPARARLCAFHGSDDPKCLIHGTLTTDIDVTFPVGVALGIADAHGRATRGCRALYQANGKTRGCAVTYRVVERPAAVAWGTP